MYIHAVKEYIDAQRLWFSESNPEGITSETAKQLLHKWKGASSNLGIQPLSQILQNWENRETNLHFTQSDWKEMLQALGSLSILANERLRGLEGQMGNEKESKNKIDGSKVVLEEKESLVSVNSSITLSDKRTNIEAMILSFQKGNLNQLGWKELETWMGQSEFKEESFQLQKAIEQFDFDRAIQILEKLNTQIGADQT